MSDRSTWRLIGEHLQRHGFFPGEIQDLIDAVRSGDRSVPLDSDWHPQDWEESLRIVEQVAAQAHGSRVQEGHGRERRRNDGRGDRGRSGRGGEGSGGGGQPPQPRGRGRDPRSGRQGNGGGRSSREGEGGHPGQQGGDQSRDSRRPARSQSRGRHPSDEEMMQAWQEAARQQAEMWRARGGQGEMHGPPRYYYDDEIDELDDYGGGHPGYGGYPGYGGFNPFGGFY